LDLSLNNTNRVTLIKQYFRIIALVGIANCLLLLDSEPLLAMKCSAETLSFNEERNASTAIFSGKVLSVNEAGHVYFEVSKVWKGAPLDTMRLITDYCTPNIFQVNNEYLVYAGGKENNLSNRLNSRTKLLTKAGSDLWALGKGKAPTIQNWIPPIESPSASPRSISPELSKLTVEPSPSSDPKQQKSLSSNQKVNLPMVAGIIGGITSIIAFYLLKISRDRSQ
jgi:hypothetical protein